MILVVDDDPEVARAHKALVESLGYQATIECNPTRVESHLMNSPEIEVILLDEFDVKRGVGGRRVHNEIAWNAVNGALRHKKFAVGVSRQPDGVQVRDGNDGPGLGGVRLFRCGERKRAQCQKGRGSAEKAAWEEHPLLVSAPLRFDKPI